MRYTQLLCGFWASELRGLRFARQVFYQLSHLPDLGSFSYFICFLFSSLLLPFMQTQPRLTLTSALPPPVSAGSEACATVTSIQSDLRSAAAQL